MVVRSVPGRWMRGVTVRVAVSRDRSGFVALDQVRTVDGERLVKKLGRLAPTTTKEVHRVLQELFAE